MTDQVSRELLSALHGLSGNAGIYGRGQIGDIPTTRGAYALLIRLSGQLRFTRRAVARTLAPGWYVYVGSAYGPGGLSARLHRHFRREKALRWHVDHLTMAASRIEAVAVPSGAECEIGARLLRNTGFRPSIPGFGSSDCRTCATHLLQWTGRDGAARS